MVDRRMFLKTSVAAAVAASVPGQLWIREAFGTPLAAGLSDPALQPKFLYNVPNALDPGFVYEPVKRGNKAGIYNIAMRRSFHDAGLVDEYGGPLPPMPIFGYGYDDDGDVTWPGRTFVVNSNEETTIRWNNDLGLGHILPVDKSLHWCYSLHGYEHYTLDADGVPAVAHVHGHHSIDKFDGNPEFFYSPDYEIIGPSWATYGGVKGNNMKGNKNFLYPNDQPAGTVWYHDHALGITRLNVYAGLAGFYIIRDDQDTGAPGNSLNLPAFPYEAAFAIQDRMFTSSGQLFYPSLPGDPFYDDFITGEGAILPPDIFPGGGPSALAEFFGDHMVVNGKIWPKMNVEPRNYRLRLLNGCDSRFVVAQFFEVPAGATDFTEATGPLNFTIIGGDQGLNSSPTETDTLVMETGSRYDIIFDFKTVTPGSRVIMKNIGGDSPFGFAFGDDLDSDDLFPDRQTDRIMAFDVVLPFDSAVSDVAPMGVDPFGAYVLARSDAFPTTYNPPAVPDRVRKVALFEGTDEFGRLQPLLGTAEKATDYEGNVINWPATPEYANAGLTGQMEGAIAWHSPTTENPNLGDTEEWLIANVTGDAHPIHLHQVHFEVMDRQEIVWDSRTNEDDRVLVGVDPEEDPEKDGTYLVEQPVVQHNGTLGSGFKVVNLTLGANVDAGYEYVDAESPKDMVAALPGQVTRIRATFDKPGRYVWHCHILSHEDHEMMRVLHVGEGA